MTTSLAAPKAETYAAPGRYYTASPGTSGTILKNFTAPMTPRYYTGGAGGFRSYSPGQQATLRGAGLNVGMMGQSLARSAMGKINPFPAATSSMSTGITNALGLTSTGFQHGFAPAVQGGAKFAPATGPTALGSTLTKAMPYLAAATSFFTTQGSYGRKAGNAAASFATAYLWGAPDPTGITKVIAAVITGIQMLVGMSGGKGNRNIAMPPIGLSPDASSVLRQQQLESGPFTLKKYRYYQNQFNERARKADAAGALTQQRIGALSRIFPGMRAVSEELDVAKNVMYSTASDPAHGISNIQHYVNALTKSEYFIDTLLSDKPVQGYVKRKTNMPFEEFKKGFDFSTDLNLTERFRLPAAHAAISNVLSTAQKAPVIGRSRRTGAVTQYGPSLWDVKMGEFLGNTYRSYTTQGNRKTGRAPVTYHQVQTGWKNTKSGGRRPVYEDLSGMRYNETVAKATEYYTGPDTEVGKELKKQQDFMASTPQFGSYTQFRPFEPNWTPGVPQLGLPADAPGPDLDSLKPVLNIQDGNFAGMSGGSGYPLTRSGMGMVPRMSQGKMARQA